MKLSITVLALAFSATAFAHPNHEAQTPPPGFDMMKTLAGTWEGSGKMEGKDVPVKSTFSVTAGGSAIEEKMDPGGEHEMINMFHKEDGRLAMTHYCASGNQPHMVLKKEDGKSVAFEMEKPIGVSSMNEPHMHAVKYTLADNDTLIEEWTNVAGTGKKAGTAVFKYKRKK